MATNEPNKLIPISLTWYWSKPVGNEYHVWAEPVWMQGIKLADVQEKDIKSWVEYQLRVDIQIGYIYVKKASFKEVVVAFDCDKWLKANFLKDPRVTFELPRTLIWYFRKLLPGTLTAHVQWDFLKSFIEIRFKEFLKANHRSIFADNMRFLKKVNYDWFTYEADLQMNKITVRLKTAVLFTLLAGAAVAKKVLLPTKVDPWGAQ